MYFFKSHFTAIDDLNDSFIKSDGSLFCPVSLKNPHEGTATVELHVQGISENLLLVGNIIKYQKSIPRKGIRGGYTFKLEEPEIEKIEFFLSTYFNNEGSRRRRYPRLSIALDVMFRIPGTPPKYPARLLDIAEGGARIETSVKDLIGQTISIEIRSEKSLRPIVLSAEIVNNPETGVYGIKWLTREKGIHSLLREFIRRLKNGIWIFIAALLSLYIFPTNADAQVKVKYSWSLNKSGITNNYSLEASRDGSIYFSHSIGRNDPQRVKIPKDEVFTKNLFNFFDDTQKKSLLIPPVVLPGLE